MKFSKVYWVRKWKNNKKKWWDEGAFSWDRTKHKTSIVNRSKQKTEDSFLKVEELTKNEAYKIIMSRNRQNGLTTTKKAIKEH